MARTAYSKEVFDGNAARNIQPKRIRETNAQKRERENLIRITEAQLRKARRQSIQYSRVIASVFSIALLTSLVVFSIAGQVQLNELTSDIADKSYELTQLESVQIQLEMQASTVFDEDVIKEYVQTNLNMSQISESQVEYINITNTDKATVYIENKGNIFQRIADFFGF